MSAGKNKASPFTGAQSPPPPPIAGSPALLVFLLCFVFGLVAVLYLARQERDAARAKTGAEARARAAYLESALNQAFASVRILGASAKETGGDVSNFQKSGSQLLSLCPVLASVALEPGGVVSQVVPRIGHERMVGANMLKNPAQSAGASATIQSRSLTAAGPFTLEDGGSGLIARMPLFQRARDGHEYFWGFVSGAIRLSQVVEQARLGALTAQGYDFSLYAPSPTPGQWVTIASRGRFLLNDAVHEPVRALNLELHLALHPRVGWFNATKVGLELVMVLLIAASCYLVTVPVQARFLAAKQEATTARQTELRLVEEKAQLAELLRSATEGEERAQSRLKQAEQRASDLQTQLGTATRATDEAGQRGQAELNQTQADLQKAHQTIQELQARVEETVNTERKKAATAQARLEQDRTTIAELQRRLDLASRVAKESAELNANRVRGLEDENRALKERWQNAQQKVTDLTSLLDAAKAQLHRLQARQAEAEIPLEAPPAWAAPVDEVVDQQNEGSDSAAEPTVTPPSLDEEVAAKDPPPQVPTMPSSVSADPAMSDADVQPHADNTSTEAGPREPKEPEPEPVAETSAVAKVPEQTKPRSPKITKGERRRRDNQLDFFEAPPQAEQTPQHSEGDPPVSKSRQEKPVRRVPEPAPMNVPQFRKAVNEILPLLVDQDPGAKDCFVANRATFRSALGVEVFAEFEQWIKSGDCSTALEHLRRVAKKHGIAI